MQVRIARLKVLLEKLDSDPAAQARIDVLMAEARAEHGPLSNEEIALLFVAAEYVSDGEIARYADLGKESLQRAFDLYRTDPAERARIRALADEIDTKPQEWEAGGHADPT